MKLTRLTELMSDLSRRWDEPLLKDSRAALSTYDVDGRREVVKSVYSGTADQETRQSYFVLEALPNFLESIAIMRRRGLSLDLIDDHWGAAIVTTWRSWSPATEFLRQRLQTPTIYENLEKLAEKIEHRRGGAPSTTAPASPD